MYDDEYEFDYDRVIEDTDELYEDDYYTTDYSDEPNYEEYEHYYHSVMDELDNE
jgi:hypothetical protein